MASFTFPLAYFLAYLSVLLPLVAGLELKWPSNPETNVKFSMQWSGGTPPYTFYALTPDLSKYYYKYQGSALVTYWDFSVTAGTEVVFQVTDSTNLQVSSPPVTVIADLTIKYPTTPQQGEISSIQWGGGVPPYVVYVLTPDLQKQYWTYSGSATSAQWNCNINAGTQIVFQSVDSNGVKATSNAVTVNPNAGQLTLSSVSLQSLASISSMEHNSQVQASVSLISVASTASVASQTITSTSTSTTQSSATPTINNPFLTSSISTAQSSSGVATITVTKTSSTSSSSIASQTHPVADENGSHKSSSNAGAIAGGVVGGLAGLAIIAAIGYFILRRSRGEQQDDPDYIPPAAVFPSSTSGNQGPTLPTFQGSGQIAQNPFDTPPAHSDNGGFSSAQQPQMGYFAGAPVPIVMPVQAGRPDSSYYDDYGNGSQLPYMEAPPVAHQPQYGVTGAWNQAQQHYAGQPQMDRAGQQGYPTSQYSGPLQSDSQSTSTNPSTTTGPSQSLLSSAQRTTGVYSGHAEV